MFPHVALHNRSILPFLSESEKLFLRKSLQDEDVEWKAPWMVPDEILYQCGDFDWVPLLGLAQCEFTYKGDNYKKKWWGKRVNENIPMSSKENTQPIEEHLQVILSELEIIKQDFKKRSSELEKKIEYLEEEKMKLGLDVNKLQDARVREDALKRDLLENQNEKVRLRTRVAVLERLMHQYHSHNSSIELKASLNNIEELKRKIEELETILQNCKLRVELLETNNKHWKKQFQRSQGQIRDRDHIMGEVVTQVREVADHLQTLAAQADMLSLKYESESDQGRESAWLLKKVKALNMQDQLQTQLQEQLVKVQQDMRDQIQESQRSMISQLTQLLAGGTEKGKRTVNYSGDDNEDPI
ncbi:hypothetical protein Goklo_008411 [Gossypium klotzschianum]|uniref:Uncharacterized protein n=1 Tax=Gossypium klotzschianum TaxID=34286 RepID=A0A7J8V0D5_9ROSI|nr:hypothetical protein [Gossypium klotzschianum]